MSRKRRLALVATTALALGLVACGDDDEGAAEGDAGGRTATVADVKFTSPENQARVGLPEPERTALKIAIISPLEANEAVKYQSRAAQLETERMGGTATITDSEANPDKQVSLVEQAIAQDVDAIVTEPLDPKALAPVLARARRAGIALVGIDVNFESTTPGEGFDAQVWSRRDYHAYLQAKEAARLMGEDASFGQVGFAVKVAGLEHMVERAAHWARQFGLTPVGRADNPSDDIAGGEKAMTELIGRYPDIAGVIAYNEESVTGGAAAVRAAGKRDLVLIGNNGGSTGFASVRDGKIDATVQTQRPDTGRYAVWLAYALKAGDRPPKTVKVGEPKVITEQTVDRVPTWPEVLQERYGKE